MFRLSRTMLLGVAAIVVVAAIGGGLAYTLTSHSGSSSPVSAAAPPADATPAPTGHGKPKGRHSQQAAARGGLLGRIQHGEFTTAAAAGGNQVMDIQRGVVTTVDAGSMTLRSEDGYTARYEMTPDTAMVAPRAKKNAAAQAAPDQAGQLAPTPGPPQANDTVQVVATETATGATATRITTIRSAA